jgi:anti-anti-sigma regulatory factor
VADDILRITKPDRVPGLIIAGEIDESSYTFLVQGLAALTPRGDVHIDLGSVEFCDLAGLRAIISVAGPAAKQRPRRRLVLHAVPRQLRRIMEILGWDEAPGVVFDQLSLPGARAGRIVADARGQHACQ